VTDFPLNDEMYLWAADAKRYLDEGHTMGIAWNRSVTIFYEERPRRWNR